MRESDWTGEGKVSVSRNGGREDWKIWQEEVEVPCGVCMCASEGGWVLMETLMPIPPIRLSIYKVKICLVGIGPGARE